MAEHKANEESSNSTDANSPSTSSNHSITPKDLIDQAVEKVDRLQPKQALRLYESALSQLAQLQPSDENRNLTVEALQSSAYLLLDEGNLEKAKENFQKAVQLSPDIGHEKYMYLAQISESAEALALYRRGVEVINRSLENVDLDSLKKDELRRTLSNAYCAISELYTTDLCDEPDAESSCHEAIQKAIETDESNPQAWFSSAKLLTIKSQNSEAKQALEKCLSLYWPQVKRIVSILNSRENGDDIYDDDENVEELDLEEISGIPYDGHLHMAQMMLDLDMYERAEEILEAMLEENDERHELAARCGDNATVEKMDELLATLSQTDDSGGEGDNGDVSSFSGDENDEEGEDETMNGM